MSRPIEQVVQEISAYVDGIRDEMLAMLKQLVEIESPTEHPQGVEQVAVILQQALQQIGFEARLVEEPGYGSHVWADYEVEGAPRILMMGHMDTVFPLGTGWGFSVDESRAYGPGVIDMKSGDLTALFAVKALKETVGLPVSIRIFYNSEEEPGSPASRHRIPEVTKDVDWAFVMEPSEPDGRMVSRRKGVGIFKFQVTGRSAHAGQEPEKGINANLELLHQLLSASRLADEEVGTTINPGRISGGTKPYVISDHAEGWVDVRVNDKEEQQRIEEAFRRLADEPIVTGAQVEVSGEFHRPPLMELDGSAMLQDCLRQAGRLMNEELDFGLSGAVSDGNNIAAAGIPVIDGVGPIGGRLHSRDEYMELESYFARTKLMAVTLYLLGGNRTWTNS
ncbi:M20 family peptidase [Xylanibacillus composti]|uniref:Peptidase M20 n=1 Tax=Xylanibacillus composti TaxID=1572762 RepID=A0A8J4M2K3_9BACL|nr:M20 family metallopeptidase [Xylanibacillus composti]MDT9726470.1 M20 family peptidase [Xylanibacillus composti]GIQ69960.1 peptidase M20 [Xylanibacillus composti]